MKNRIINIFASIKGTFIAIIVSTILSSNANAQNPTDPYPHQEPIQPENYLYLPSFVEHGFGLDIYENSANGIVGYSTTLMFNSSFDSTIAPPLEALSQQFLIDSTITIYGIAIFRTMNFNNLSLDSIEAWTFEDSLQIRSLDHDTIYRSVCIAHFKKPEFLNGVFEYYFDSLTISTPFTVVKTFSRDYYRKLDAYPTAMVYATRGNAPLNAVDSNIERHSFQRPSFKHYGDSVWYDIREVPYPFPNFWTMYDDFWTDSLYTDLFILPIYKKVPEPKHTIRVEVGPEHYCGNVEGGGVYDKLTYVTLQATANENYRFAQWQDGNTENPRTIRVMSDSTFTAIFDTAFNVNVSIEPAGSGNVLGGGSYAMGSEATLRVGTGANYYFIKWDDGNRDNPRTITVMSDTTLVAILDTVPPSTINMAEIGNAITISPNPAATTLNIELPQSCTTELRNIKGVLIETKQLQANATQWNIEALPPGVYMLTFRNKDWVITRKFVKK